MEEVTLYQPTKILYETSIILITKSDVVSMRKKIINHNKKRFTYTGIFIFLILKKKKNTILGLCESTDAKTNTLMQVVCFISGGNYHK